MTYSELAEARGIKLNSARKLAQKRRWERKAGNDGMARVGVPIEVLDMRTHAPTPDPIPEDTPDHSSELAQIPVLEAQIAGLKDLVAAEKKRADAAEVNAEQWRQQATKSFWRRLVG